MKSVVVVGLVGVAMGFVACSSQGVRYTDVPVEVTDSGGNVIAVRNASGEEFPVKMSKSNEELAAEELASSSKAAAETAGAPEAPKKTALQELLHQELKAVYFETDEHQLDDQAKA